MQKILSDLFHNERTLDVEKAIVGYRAHTLFYVNKLHRFIQGDKLDPVDFVHFVKHHGGIMPEREKQYIKEDPLSATLYAHHIIRRRWPEAEANIISSPSIARVYWQLMSLIRWVEAERMIAHSSLFLFHYTDNLKRHYSQTGNKLNAEETKTKSI